jgi:uncharacterized protein YprB with RNaseH-like and TPR domain
MKAAEYHWMALDIEVVPRDDAERWLAPVKPDGRLKDEAKIAADIADKEAAQREKCALDWNCSRVVVLGYQTEDMAEPKVLNCFDTSEDQMLRMAWFNRNERTRTIISFNGIRFDMPTLVQRSRYLGVTHPHLSFRKWDNPHVRDLYMELTFDDAPCTHVMERSLDNFCQQFGIEVDDDVDGADVPKLWADGDYDCVIEHCRRDIHKTVALARAIGAIHVDQRESAAVI